MLNVDYYEIEFNDGSGWAPLPGGAAQIFQRQWLHVQPGPIWTSSNESFPFVPISGHNVVQSREHFEVNGGLAGWGINRFWITNRDLVVPINSAAFVDDTYRFRVIGWQLNSGNLINPRVLPVCGSETENDLILTFDNRSIDPVGHIASHNCGPVHGCTTEPDTHILAVRINGQPVQPCDTVDAATGLLEIDFQANDPDRHLALYSLVAKYGLNQQVNLLNRPGSVIISLSGDPIGPTYGQALAQGAVAPHWGGGHYRLTVPANQAFPLPCCYQLELRAWKRTVESCSFSYPHRNLTEYTLGVGICSRPNQALLANSNLELAESAVRTPVVIED